MIYQKLDENELEIIKRVSEKTFTDYELLGEFIPNESFMSIIKDLLFTVESLEEELEDSEKEKRELYRPITREEELL
ncbi:MAG: hypothetical protein IJ501_06590 [Bacilli bacterium]|nr:hypothetical protein [Bacilli bacterium]